MSDGKEAVIPLVSSVGKSVGVIVAEKSEGFTPADYDNFRHGCQIVNTVELALKKEFEHQGRITDELTHLKNRQGLNEYLSNTMCGNLNDGKTVNIVMCDIDHFKQVNDTYGHDAGDIILKGVADVLQEGTRAGADCAFRMGGEEMVCIINSEPEVAMDIAERLRSTIENTVHNIQHEGKPLDVKVTVSMGVHTMDPKGAVTPENARKVFDKEFKHADKAVYDAKESGRNRVVNNNELTNLKYLALKAAEVMCGDNKDQKMVDEMKKFAITCLTNILRENKNFTWTICSANDELRMTEFYGYHYEIITLLRELQDLERNPEIIIPTQNIYFFIEKIPINYAGSTNHEEVTVEGAEEPVPSASGIGPYLMENRWYTMCHMYYWAQKFKELYPDEMEVYYETESFICYRIHQNVNSPYNLAIDYGYNNPMPKTGNEEE